MSNRWRLLEINARLPLARFLAIQEEDKAPQYNPGWRELEPLAAEEGFAAMEPNGIGNRHGRWREGPMPAEPRKGENRLHCSHYKAPEPKP